MLKRLADLARRLVPKRPPTLRELAEQYSTPSEAYIPGLDATRRLALANGTGDTLVYNGLGDLIDGSPEAPVLRAGTFVVTAAEVTAFRKARSVHQSERVERHRHRDPLSGEVRWVETKRLPSVRSQALIYDRDRAARQIMRDKLIAAVREPHVNDARKDEAILALIDLNFPQGGYETRQQAV